VKQNVDLDQAALVLFERIADWRRRGLDVGEPTWRDQGRGWPWQLKVDRAATVDPDSLGVRVRHGEAEGAVVLFCAGFADFEFWDGTAEGDPVLDAPDELTLASYRELLDRLARLFAENGQS